MKYLYLFIITTFLLTSQHLQGQNGPPLTKEKPLTEEIHGIQISDPFRYLEKLDDPEVEQWYRDQEAYALKYLRSHPIRDKLERAGIQLISLFNNNQSTVAIQEDYIIYSKNTDFLHSLSEIYLYERKSGKTTFLFNNNDPRIVDTAAYTYNNLRPSPDMRYLAVSSTKKDGSETKQIRIWDLEKQDALPLQVNNADFTDWCNDSRTFSFRRWVDEDVQSAQHLLNSKAFLYDLDQQKEYEVLSTAVNPELSIEPQQHPSVMQSPHSAYIFGRVGVAGRSYSRVFYSPSPTKDQPTPHWREILRPEDQVYQYYPNGDHIYFLTEKGAPNFQLLRRHLKSGETETIIPGSDLILHDLAMAGDYFAYVLRDGLQCRLYTRSVKNGIIGTSNEIDLPQAGMAYISTNPIGELILSLSSWLQPPQQYIYDQAQKEWIENPVNQFPEDFPWKDKLQVEETWVTARDGVKVPLTLIYHKDLKKDGTNPVLLTAYGSYGISQFPGMIPPHLLLAEHKVVIAIAHVRGGGELGKAWHLAGKKKNKPNTWRDFIDCAEWMIGEKITTPEKLIGEGASAGGILIGRAVTERPDLFTAAVAGVGVMNTSRFAYTPNGKGHFEEFGNPEIKEEFQYLCEMDAYLHLKDGVAYPAMLITAGWNDLRVIPWQPAKFAARLQRATTSGKPVYFSTSFAAGHFSGPGSPDFFHRNIDRLIFMLDQWGMELELE